MGMVEVVEEMDEGGDAVKVGFGHGGAGGGKPQLNTFGLLFQAIQRGKCRTGLWRRIHQRFRSL